jgi:hypothetical protein
LFIFAVLGLFFSFVKVISGTTGTSISAPQKVNLLTCLLKGVIGHLEFSLSGIYWAPIRYFFEYSRCSHFLSLGGVCFKS